MREPLLEVDEINFNQKSSAPRNYHYLIIPGLVFFPLYSYFKLAIIQGIIVGWENHLSAAHTRFMSLLE